MGFSVRDLKLYVLVKQSLFSVVPEKPSTPAGAQVQLSSVIRQGQVNAHQQPG